MKKIIYVGMALLLALFVLGINEGDGLTQQQVDNINADTIGLHCQPEEGHLGIVYKDGNIYKGNYYRNASCRSIRKNNTNYVVTRISDTPKFLIKNYKRCVNNYYGYLYLNPSQLIKYCNSEYNAKLRRQFNQWKKSIRQDIKDFQTPEEASINDFEDVFVVV